MNDSENKDQKFSPCSFKQLRKVDHKDIMAKTTF